MNCHVLSHLLMGWVNLGCGTGVLMFLTFKRAIIAVQSYTIKCLQGCETAM